ncbi:hypothetical protein [Campylobacter sp. CCUG 57310]|uniref:hypothetical protein n=1 Tax=Campylobacter sp. CCUG 57310 TaxID=2517362 RepID=UPI001566CA2B|nr:hypothetical protein [Campylobacter sp. CCUG 57310]QKF92534.1 hypothetical protein CORI_1346 [Campylobacter sp. CCUG 57310]
MKKLIIAALMTLLAGCGLTNTSIEASYTKCSDNASKAIERKIDKFLKNTKASDINLDFVCEIGEGSDEISAPTYLILIREKAPNSY